jgi:hypothetical protein
MEVNARLVIMISIVKEMEQDVLHAIMTVLHVWEEQVTSA